MGQDPAVAAANRLDYERSLDLYGELVKIRFQLLGLLPTISGAILAALELLDVRPAVLIGPAVLGLVVTWAITLYEIRNSQIHDNLIHRLRHLERLIGFDPSIPSSKPGGFLDERTERALYLLPVTSDPLPERDTETPRRWWRWSPRIRVRHDSALALVYGAVLATWAAVAVFNVVAAIGTGSAVRSLAWVAAAVAAVLVGGLGWRIVSALSQTGRNVPKTYLLEPLAARCDGEWCAKTITGLTAITADKRVGELLTADELKCFVKCHTKKVYDLAMSTCVLTHRRVLDKGRLRDRVEVGKNSMDDLKRKSLNAIVGLTEVDAVDSDEWRASRALKARYGNAPWTQPDEVQYRIQWLDHLNSLDPQPTATVASPTGDTQPAPTGP